MAVEVVLFDIDGTLISTGGASDRAWHRAFAELHGAEVDVGDYTGKGVTDPVVGRTSFRGALGREPTAEEMKALMDLRLRHLPEEVERSASYRVMPGAPELLERLDSAGLLLGLITGNVEPAAGIKLAPSGLGRFFRFGGYGSDADERAEVARIALGRAAELLPGELALERCLAFGDTPNDVEAAHAAGIRLVGVATGEYATGELEAAGADWAVGALTDPLPV